MSKHIGFIGLGSMGQPMAARLVRAGFTVIVTYHRNKAPAEALKAMGADMVDTIREVALKSDIIITVLPADDEIKEVYRSSEGLLVNLRPGAVCIDMTSARPDTIKEVADQAAAKGITVLDAPVSGGVIGAQNGTLTIMIGGNEDIVEECRPILEAMGKKIFYTGEVGSGKAVKMINQLLNACNTYIASEALCLAKAMAIDPVILCNVINESSGGSWVFQNTVPKFIIPGNFKSGFKLNLMKKDIGLAMQQANQDGISLPITGLIYQIYQAVSNQGYDDKNYSIVSQWICQQNPWLSCSQRAGAK